MLSVVDRVSELLFGLFMALTFVGAVSVTDAGQGEIRSMFAAALGCNLAWGLVDDAERAGTSRVTWEIEPVGDSCRLTVIHDQLPPDAPAELYGGWPMILSGLKTWLETGQTLTTPGSLMYQPQQ